MQPAQGVGAFSPRAGDRGPRFSVSEETGQQVEQKGAFCPLIMS